MSPPARHVAQLPKGLAIVFSVHLCARVGTRIDPKLRNDLCWVGTRCVDCERGALVSGCLSCNMLCDAGVY